VEINSMTEEFSDQKKRLLEVAMELISDHGYTGTSIRDIAQAHGTSISNIYHYFGNKDGLLVAILQHLSLQLIQSLRDVAAKYDDPLESLKQLIKVHLNLSVENVKGAKIFLLDAEHFSSEGNRISREIQIQVLSIYVDQLRRLQDAGIINNRNLKIMAFNILACINWQMRWFHPEGPLTAEKAHQDILDFILYGVAGSASPENY
jgi:AcrR family transcriptional regulator